MLKHDLGQMVITERPSISPTQHLPPGLSTRSQVQFSRGHDTVNHFLSPCGENVSPQNNNASPGQNRVQSSNGHESATPSPLRHSTNVCAPNHLLNPGVPKVYVSQVPGGYDQPRHILHPLTDSRDATYDT